MSKFACRSCGKTDWRYCIPDDKTAPIHPQAKISTWTVCPGSHQPLIERVVENDARDS